MTPALASGLIVAAGAGAAGFAQGMTGFAFASVALSIWAWALPPQTAAPLAVFGALLGQLASLVSFRGGFEWPKILPFVAGGVVGAPIGVFLLHNANTEGFRLGVGVLLMAYCLFGLFFRDLGHVKHGGRGLDALFGGVGGVLGGLGGMAGFAPAMWTQLRGWKRDLRRATMQAYNIAMHCLTISLYARTGTLDTRGPQPVSDRRARDADPVLDRGEGLYPVQRAGLHARRSDRARRVGRGARLQRGADAHPMKPEGFATERRRR